MGWSRSSRPKTEKYAFGDQQWSAGDTIEFFKAQSREWDNLGQRSFDNAHSRVGACGNILSALVCVIFSLKTLSSYLVYLYANCIRSSV